MVSRAQTLLGTGQTMTRYIMTTQSADRTGIVATLTTALAKHEGFINSLSQFGTPGSERFYSRIEFEMADPELASFKESLKGPITQYDLLIDIIPKSRKTHVLILVSKFDHCLADIVYRQNSGSLNIEIIGVVSNHETVRSMVEMRGLPFFHIPVTAKTKHEAEAQLRSVIAETGTELIVLARYMQILSNTMCRDFSGKIINIHHSFLPSFKGAKPYHRAYARGVKLIGATAHYVTADLDEGPIIEQCVERVDHTMTPETLIAKGRDVEAQTLARAVQMHTEHRSFMNGVKTVILS